jgi:hypothetical protein
VNDFSESQFAFRGPFSTAYVRISPSTRITPIDGTPEPIQEEIPISQLPLAGPIFGDELVPIVQNGITCRTTAASFGSGGTPAAGSTVETELLTITTLDVIPPLSKTPDGEMTLLIVNGRVFSDVSGAFSVSGNVITWIDPLFSIYPGDEVVATYTVAGGGSGGGGMQEDVLTITTLNVIPPLSAIPSGTAFTLFVDGRPFFLGVASPAFSILGVTITWISTIWSVNPGAEVVAVYSVAAGAVGTGTQEDVLTIDTLNTFPLLSETPVGDAFTLYVDGRPFFLGVASPAFSLSGKQITWVSSIYSVYPGAEVVAQYSV